MSSTCTSTRWALYDALIDIVGSIAGLHELGVSELYCSALPVGEGWIDSHHGRLPLPAPATLELLAAAGAPTRPAPGAGEWVTPTAAALLAELAIFRQPVITLQRVGIGTGERDPAWPNIGACGWESVPSVGRPWCSSKPISMT